MLSCGVVSLRSLILYNSDKLILALEPGRKLGIATLPIRWLYSFLSDALMDNFPKVRMFRSQADVQQFS